MSPISLGARCVWIGFFVAALLAWSLLLAQSISQNRYGSIAVDVAWIGICSGWIAYHVLSAIKEIRS